TTASTPARKRSTNCWFLEAFRTNFICIQAATTKPISPGISLLRSNFNPAPSASPQTNRPLMWSAGPYSRCLPSALARTCCNSVHARYAYLLLGLVLAQNRAAVQRRECAKMNLPAKGDSAPHERNVKKFFLHSRESSRRQRFL